MRIKLLVLVSPALVSPALVSLILSVAAKAEEPIWFVSVYGENMQLISGASATPDVRDGVFLSTDFVGTMIYVRVKQGYELDGFRPYESASSGATVSSASESADSAARASEPEAQSRDEFGPLSDTGLQYYVNDDYFGWVCSQMYVQAMGDGIYCLRCDDKKPMKHSN